MRDITAILIHYHKSSTLVKALHSLQQLGDRLTSIIVFQEKQLKPADEYGNDQHIQFIPINGRDLGDLINDTVHHLTESHILFLSDPACLAPNSAGTILKFLPSIRPLGTSITYRDQTLQLPILVPRTFLLKSPLLPEAQLPFREALLPAWLCRCKGDSNNWGWKKELINSRQTNTAANTMQKRHFLYKYQLPQEAITGYPSLSIMIANYNMEKYLETAVRSSFLQTEQPEEVFVIDDGSTDQSRSLLKQWEGKKNINVFCKRNGGKARALNVLLPHLTTDFVLELDADDWLDPDAIKRAKTYLADLPKKASLLYGNLRKWKQPEREDVFYKTTAKGMVVRNWAQLQEYPFPLGPRIYRTSLLKHYGGFPVLEFADGRLYEDVSILKKLIRNTLFCYRDFTVYNVREHKQSITKQHQAIWNDFIKAWKEEKK